MKKDQNFQYIQNVLKKWFIDKKKIIDLEEDFFKKNVLDSLEVITLVEFLEIKFNIKFNHQEFQKKDFKSISGIAKIIFNKKNEI